MGESLAVVERDQMTEYPYEPPSTRIQQRDALDKEETRIQRALRRTVAVIVGGLAVVLFADIWSVLIDGIKILPRLEVIVRVGLLAGQVVTILGACLLLMRNALAISAFATMCAYCIILAITRGDAQTLVLSLPATIGFVYAATMASRA